MNAETLSTSKEEAGFLFLFQHSKKGTQTIQNELK